MQSLRGEIESSLIFSMLKIGVICANSSKLRDFIS